MEIGPNLAVALECIAGSVVLIALLYFSSR